MFNRLAKRPLQTFKDAFPRTVAPLMAASAVKTSLSAGFLASAYAAAFAMDDPKVSTVSVVAILGASVGFDALLSGSIAYGLGYGGANVAMAAFPKLQVVQTRLLVGPGYAGQIGLFSASLAIPIVKACVKAALTYAKSDLPKMNRP